MKSKLLLMLMALSTSIWAQQSMKDHAALDLLRQQILDNNKQLIDADLQELRITDQSISKQSGLQHTYAKQFYKGIEIFNAISSIHVQNDGDILKINDRFEGDVPSRINATAPKMNSLAALQQLVAKHSYQPNTTFKIIKTTETTNQQQLISANGIAKEAIPARLVYCKTAAGELRLAWNLTIQETGSNDVWNSRVDAETGALLEQFNMTDNCSHFSEDHVCSTEHSPKGNHSACEETMFGGMSGSYHVFEFPIQHPGDGSRSIVVSPHDPIASPFGWHDTDGVVGAEFTTTNGNNVEAYDKGTLIGYMPDGGATLNFDFPLDLTQVPSQNIDASLSQVFYSGNWLHDVFYHYGFDEASGNLQRNNYGNGGVENDQLKINVQSATATCNASLYLPQDGMPGEMNVFICNNRDIAFSNVVVAHEFGHAVSRRLVAGPSSVTCMNNTENMTEGWSDYIGVLLTMKATDVDTTRRPIADWFLNNPAGARPYYFTKDMAVNPSTYNTIKTAAVPHGLGAVWTTMLWDLTWDLIDEYGFDADFSNGNGGNNVALQLVVEGFKLTPCNAGFTDGRDAILAADQSLYSGANECIIWKAFARRGLGLSSNQGSTSSKSDGVEAFDVPVLPSCILSEVSETIDALKTFELYPNPSNGQFTAVVAFAEDKEAEFAIYNVLGQPLYTKQLSGQSFEIPIDLAGAAAGVYISKLQAGDEKVILRFVVME